METGTFAVFVGVVTLSKSTFPGTTTTSWVDERLVIAELLN
jgi:hypothetical protein